MKLIEFDGLFDEKLTVFMEENKNKYTERQWEDLIPKLYKKFGDTYVAKIKCTPKEYYAKMTDEQLVETLSGHIREDIPVPEFLCAEIEERGAVETLAPMLSLDSESAVYAFNLIGDDERAYDTYFEILKNPNADEDLKSDIADLFKLHADDMKDKALKAYKNGENKEAMLEILSRVKERSEEIYTILLSEFSTYENIPMRASYLAAYGDERALKPLLKKIEDRSIGFVEFQELKYAIEALGGEYNEPRDFSADKDFLAVETASSKSPFPEN
jgi:hypothetical protein